MRLRSKRAGDRHGSQLQSLQPRSLITPFSMEAKTHAI